MPFNPLKKNLLCNEKLLTCSYTQNPKNNKIYIQITNKLNTNLLENITHLLINYLNNFFLRLLIQMVKIMS